MNIRACVIRTTALISVSLLEFRALQIAAMPEILMRLPDRVCKYITDGRELDFYSVYLPQCGGSLPHQHQQFSLDRLIQ